MILNLLIWIDLHLFRCRWGWFCDWVWECQMLRDVETGAIDNLYGGDIGAFFAAHDDHRDSMGVWTQAELDAEDADAEPE